VEDEIISSFVLPSFVCLFVCFIVHFYKNVDIKLSVHDVFLE